MTVTVYSSPGCVQCNATYRYLTKKGIDFESVDITTDDEALAEVKALGYVQVPVVVTSTKHWSGFKPDEMDALAA